MRTSCRRLIAMSGVLLAVSVLSACQDETTGDPTFPGQSGSDPSNAGRPGVPRVSDPLDAGPFLGDPCKLVDEATLSGIAQFKPGEPDVNSEHAKKLIGPSCDWFSEDFGPTISLVIDTVHQEKAGQGLKGMDGVYASKEDGLMDYLQPTEVAGHPGYPAAVAGMQDEITAGKCPLHVGIADDLIFIASVTDEDNPTNACPAANKVAAAVLTALKRGS